jgi:RNA recognition motif-containing protein
MPMLSLALANMSCFMPMLICLNLNIDMIFPFLKGTAEVVFTRRSDAIAALKRYNNVLLDGKSMKIEVVGSDLGLPMTPRINIVGASNGRATRTVVLM